MTYTDTMQLETTGLLNETPENHKALIVRIPEPRVHTNADTLELFDILGYQLVAKKGNYKAGDLAVFIQPDSVVPQAEPFRWLWEPAGAESLGSWNPDDKVVISARRRRITVRKFRKEYSEGLLTPLTELANMARDYAQSNPNDPRVTQIGNGGSFTFREGDDVSDVFGITHWEGEEECSAGPSKAPRMKRRPKTVMGWLRFFYYNTVRLLSGGRAYRRESSLEVPFQSPEYDVVSMKAARSGFAPEERITATEKLHGSNGRFLFLDGVFYIGSHFQWKSLDVPCIFTRVFDQQPWIGDWCHTNPGRILYGEVLGDQKGYTYGYEGGALGFRAFDIWEPTGTWTKPWTDTKDGVHTLAESQIVPILYQGLADIEKLKSITDGKSAIDGKTQREGIVVSEDAKAAEGHRRPRQVKRVSNVFLEKDSAAK